MYIGGGGGGERDFLSLHSVCSRHTHQSTHDFTIKCPANEKKQAYQRHLYSGSSVQLRAHPAYGTKPFSVTFSRSIEIFRIQMDALTAAVRKILWVICGEAVVAILCSAVSVDKLLTQHTLDVTQEIFNAADTTVGVTVAAERLYDWLPGYDSDGR